MRKSPPWPGGRDTPRIPHSNPFVYKDLRKMGVLLGCLDYAFPVLLKLLGFVVPELVTEESSILAR